MNTFTRPSGYKPTHAPMPLGMLEDPALSYKAKGLMAYLLSRPAEWKVWEKDLVNRSKDSRDSVRSAIKELVALGYIARQRTTNDKGRFSGYIYTFYESPIQEVPRTDFPATDNPLHNKNQDIRKNSQHPHAPSPMRDNLRTLEAYKRDALAS